MLLSDYNFSWWCDLSFSTGILSCSFTTNLINFKYLYSMCIQIAFIYGTAVAETSCFAMFFIFHLSLPLQNRPSTASLQPRSLYRCTGCTALIPHAFSRCGSVNIYIRLSFIVFSTTYYYSSHPTVIVRDSFGSSYQFKIFF